MINLDLKDYIPIFVAILSAILTFIFNKFKDKNTVYLENTKTSLNQIVSRMYKDLIEITNVNNYCIKKIKDFIINYSSNENLSLLGNDEVIYDIYVLNIKIKNGVITNEELKSKFYKISLKVETIYWNLLKASVDDYNWWIEKKTRNKWYSFLGSFIMLFKGCLEYITITLTFFIFFFIANYIINKQNIIDIINLFIPSEIIIHVIVITILIWTMYLTIFYIYFTSFGEKKIKPRKLIKNPNIQLEYNANKKKKWKFNIKRYRKFIDRFAKRENGKSEKKL